MTSKTDKLRAVFLTALMIGSVFAAGIAFTGGAAAAQSGDVTLDPAGTDDGVQTGESLTINVTDADANADSSAVDTYYAAAGTANGESDATGSSETLLDGSTSAASGEEIFTGVILDTADDGIATGTEVSFTENSGDTGDGISITKNDNGTVTVTASAALEAGDTVTLAGAANPSEVVELTETGQDTGEFSGSITVSAAATASPNDGTLQAQNTQVDGSADDTINVIVSEAGQSGSSYQQTVNTKFDAQGSTGVVSAIAYDDSTVTTSGSTVDDIEVAFNQDVYQNDTDLNNLANLDGNNVTVYVNDAEVSASVDASTDPGAIDISLSNTVDANDDIIVNVDRLQDDAGNTYAPGNISVTNTAQTINADGGTADNFGTPDSNAFQGEAIALDFDTSENAQFEINTETEFVFSGSSGVNSDVYVFNTADRNVSTDYSFGGTDAAYTLGLRNLGLSATADDTSVSTEDPLAGTASANSGDRDVTVTLLDSSDDAVTSQTVTLDGSGEGTFSFDALGDGNAGNYTVEVSDVGTGVTATTDTYVVTSAADDSSEFVSNTRTERGDVGTVNVSITGTDTATVHLGSDSNGYEANVTVTDGDGDGYVAFDVNTYLMGGAQGASGYSVGDAYSVVNSDDSISVTQETTTLPRVIATGGYQMSVRTGSNAADSPQDLTQFYVAAGPSLNAQNIWTAPGTISLSSVADSGALTQDSSITWKDSPRGDYVVHQFDSPGVFGLIEAQGSSSDEFATKAASAFGTDQLNLTLTQTEASTNQNANPFQVNEGALLSGDDATIVSDAANNTFYVIYDVEAISDHVAGSGSVEFNDGINATVELSAKSNMTKSDVSLSSEYTIAEPSTELDYDGDTLNVTNADNQSISGETNLADGTNVTITVTSQETEGDGFIESANQLTVENGEFSGDIDFSDAAVNDTFTVEVSDSQGNTLTSGVSGMVVESVDEGPTTTTEDSTTEQQTTEQQTTEQQTTEQQTTEQQTTEEQTTAAATTTTGGDDGGSSSGSIPGFGVGIALVAILGAALLALRE